MPFVFSAAVPGISKLPVLMQALFCAHREHTRSAQTHQGEATQEEHHGTRAEQNSPSCNPPGFVSGCGVTACVLSSAVLVRRSRRRTSCGPCRLLPPPSCGPWTPPCWTPPGSTASPRKTSTSAALWSPAWRRSSRSTCQVSGQKLVF